MDAGNGLLVALFDPMPDCVALLDEEGLIRFVNPAAAAAMAPGSPDVLPGQSWIERWPEMVRPRLNDALCAARRGDADRFTTSRRDTQGADRWWDVTVTPIAGEGDARPGFLVIARDVTTEIAERKRTAAISAEMRHRMKNALTIASGILAMTARGRPEVRSFVEEVTARLGQIAAIQDLLLDPARDKRLADIVPLLAGAYGGPVLIRFGATPNVRLGETAMQALALAFGELATNSLKYGALQRGEPIDVEGIVADAMLQLTWREPTAFGAPRAGAQGLGLIDRLIAASGGRFDRSFADGVYRARLCLPIIE